MGKKSEIKKKKSKKELVQSNNKNNTLKLQNLDDFLQEWSDNGENEKDGTESESNSNEDINDGLGATEQKKYLSNLKENDPDFFKFLEENDQDLLNFDESSSDEEGTNANLDEVHKHPLHDENEDDDDSESDEELEADVTSSNKLSKITVEDWAVKLEESPSVKLISEVVLALRAALTNISNVKAQTKDGNSKKKSSNLPKYKVENGQVFNTLIKVCITKLEPAISSLLKSKKKLTDNKNWRPLNKWLKAYTLDIGKKIFKKMSVLQFIHNTSLSDRKYLQFLKGIKKLHDSPVKTEP